MRTAHGNDVWRDESAIRHQSQHHLKAAVCSAQTNPLPRMENHHEITHKG
jgi:hypothetical protein